jgi:DNA repair protein RadC
MDAVRDGGDGGEALDVRTRLLALGGRACTDEELVAFVLDGGVSRPEGMTRARDLIRRAGGVARLDRVDDDEAACVRRRAGRRLAVLRAALELGRRASGIALSPAQPVRDAASVYEHFRGRLPQLDREVFVALLLDARHRLQGEIRVSEGTLTTTLVHPREVFAPALRAGAAAVILVHNHPSGDPTPSAEDAALTERLRQVGDVLGIRVLDHVVIGQGRWVSLAEVRRW